MANSRSLAQIFSDYRAVAHILEAVVLTYMLIMVFSTGGLVFGFNWVYGIILIYLTCEFLKGYLLITGIQQENQQRMCIYAIFHCCTLIIKTILLIILMCRSGSRDTETMGYFSKNYVDRTMIFSIIFVILYVVYEWLMFTFVLKLKTEFWRAQQRNCEVAP